MSEYWVSRKKYFCKYCEIYIADDAPSRQQHENGMRHKGNKERFVRNLYKQGERKKKDLEEERREMARVEQAANAAFARDVSSGLVSASSSTGAGPSKPNTSSAVSQEKKPEKPTSPFSNYSTAQSLGYTDPDAERLAAEAERRRTQGLVGEWETVAPPPPPLPGQIGDVAAKETIADEISARKRQADEGVGDVDAVRHFKVRKRTLVLGLGELWDPGDIPIILKAKKEEGSVVNGSGEDSSNLMGNGESDASGQSNKSNQALSKPKWTPKGWTRAVTEPGEDRVYINQTVIDTAPHIISPPVTTSTETANVKTDHSTSKVLDSAKLLSSTAIPSPPEAVNIKQEADVKDPSIAPAETQGEATTGGMFRKRRVPAGNRGRR